MRFKVHYLLCFCLLVLAHASAFSQNPKDSQKAEWIRVASDNGEFSVEIPAEYGFFADKDGFSASASYDTYALREMRMVNAYAEKTLISFESYKTNKGAIEALSRMEVRNGKVSEIKTGDVKIKQIVLQTPASYAVKKYFSSKNHIYVLTAASRTGETAAMKRFFDSLVFNTDAKAPDPAMKAVAFSALKGTPIDIDSAPDQPLPKSGTVIPPTPDEKDDVKLVIVSKPLASYTDAARRNSEKGIVRLRVTFSKDGRISKISTMQTLGHGLLRQCVFAAIRIKFLPQEKNNEPVTVTKPVEYSFDIY
jgi:TonB family protein